MLTMITIITISSNVTWAEWLFPDHFKSMHPALHTSAFTMIFSGIGCAGLNSSFDNDQYDYYYYNYL